MMEILNRNQRRSAIWRVAALLGVIVAVLFTILTSMQLSYENQGRGDLEAYSDSLAQQRIHYQGMVNALVQDTLRLSQVIGDLKNDDEMESEIALLRKEYDKLEKKLDKSDNDLETCQKEKVILEYKIKQLEKPK